MVVRSRIAALIVSHDVKGREFIIRRHKLEQFVDTNGAQDGSCSITPPSDDVRSFSMAAPCIVP